MKSYLAVSVCILISTGASPAGGEDLGRLETVEQVDIGRYVGRWYEIARYQHTFEKRLVGVTAEYAIRDDGKVDVVNSGYKDTLDGPYRRAQAVAWVPDPSEPGALKVRFFWPFAGDYKIFGLDVEGYRWALVGDNSRKFLWFLARDHEIPPGLFEDMQNLAIHNGFTMDDLFMVPQKPRED